MNVLAPAAAGPQPLTRTEHAAGMAAYRAAGEALAAEIGNRGPLRLTPGGDLHPDIQAAYWRHGYYIFEGVIDPAEVAALRADAQVMLDRAPTGPDSAWIPRAAPPMASTTPGCPTASPGRSPIPGAAPRRSAAATRRRWPSRSPMPGRPNTSSS
ncbi:hypothetical protein ACFQY5_27180 [Paeniroseomonas aquatica]|uniref:hypothetical protein n=1 Tax=Paeniroseomonas aquatica TaxID=373043 RepID=UPI003612BDDA